MSRSGKTVSPTILWLLAGMILLFGTAVQAATFIVANTNDAGPGSLRQAIIDANATVETDSITFQNPGTYSLTTGGLSITEGLTITGHVNGTTISQNTTNARVFTITNNALVVLSGLTLQGGNLTAGGGGGIYNNGTCYLINSTVSGNTAAGGGGGIYNDVNGYFSIDKSTLSGNTAGPGSDGGGIFNNAGPLVADPAGVIDIYNSTISGNTAGNNGGGIANLSKNTALGVSIYNATITNNTANAAGGGGGAGLATEAGMYLVNTIVALNSAGGDCNLLTPGIVISGNYNLESANTCNFNETFDQPNTNPLLNALALNAPGTTATHSLQAASPAINKGFTLGFISTDQRGVARSPQYDLGAYETDTSPLIDLSIVKSGPPDPVVAGTPFDYTISVYNLTEGTTTTGFAVLDTLPDKLVLAGPLPLGCSASGQTITCVLTNLVGQAPPALITLTVNSLQGGIIENTATVTGAQIDPDPSNNTWTELTAVNYPLPSITSLDPPSILFGAPTLTLTVNGTDFADVAVVRWNGTDLVTSYQSPTLITAVIPKALMAVANVAEVAVFNPPNDINATGGGLSNAVSFFVNNPQPSIASITPNQALSDGPGFTLTVIGSNFINGAVVKLNGTPLSTTFINGTRLTALVTPADTANPGVLPVVVDNPAPAVAPSNVLTMTVIQGYYLYLPIVGR
jgi:hypothetical protein